MNRSLNSEREGAVTDSSSLGHNKPNMDIDLRLHTFFEDANSGGKHSGWSAAENSCLGEPQAEDECTGTPATRLGVFFAASLAGKER